MAATKNTGNTPQRVTGTDILALLNRKTEDDGTLGDAVVDFTSDKINSLAVGTSRMAGAMTVGVKNTGKHYALEQAVQIARSNHKLAKAATRAAERINRFNGLTT